MISRCSALLPCSSRYGTLHDLLHRVSTNGAHFADSRPLGKRTAEGTSVGLAKKRISQHSEVRKGFCFVNKIGSQNCQNPKIWRIFPFKRKNVSQHSTPSFFSLEFLLIPRATQAVTQLFRCSPKLLLLRWLGQQS